MESKKEINATQLLDRWSNGDQSAFAELWPLIEGELRRLAHGYMRSEQPGHTLETSALINEAYMRLVDQTRMTWQNRAHFIGVAAKVMRHILVNYAKAKSAEKRGGSARPVSLDEAIGPLDHAMRGFEERKIDLLLLDDALNRLRDMDPQQARIVNLKFFGGLTNEEIAIALGVSITTVKRDWDTAQTWLYREMKKKA